MKHNIYYIIYSIIVIFLGLLFWISVPKSLQERVDMIKCKMNLCNWEVVVIEKEFGTIKDRYIGAEIVIHPEYYQAIMYVNSDIKKVPNSLLRHELYHIHMREFVDFIRLRFNPSVQDEEWIRYFEEKTVSRLTEIKL
jgi:hypothetical protein